MAGLTQTVEAPESAATLRGARVALTGRLASMTRREAHAAIRRAGGAPSSGVSKRTTMLVVGSRGWPLGRDGRVTKSLERAESFRAAGVTIRIVGEDEFLGMLRGRGAEVGESRGYPLDEVASLVGVEGSLIERWSAVGLVRSRGGLYDFRDIVSLQSLASLVRSGARPEEMRRSLEGLGSLFPDIDRPLAQLKIVLASSGELLAQIGESLIGPDGQQRLAFERAPGGESVDAAVVEEAEPTSAEGMFERALSLEEEERYAEALAAYRRVIGMAPGWADAYFNLGNVLRLLDLEEAAEEVFLLAVSIDPGNELAWYNLADLQEEDGRLEEACGSLGAALASAPGFADAHFNLASCLEQIGDRGRAREHWAAYLRLDPNSEWAEVARRHLSR